ncbi:hypothetical protein GPECTOR_93g619 [Gonium pectorale]|uniref:Uncharacterized protein n=1 Tax=Gonium pectorale TaxID=33097 RepID=A0A150G0H0_GONPE|nr:hypothetical protein GPECTOR_93g619 [Gonium pectorale]|eukprot:KXZ43349.1 hypothetical protein GPECTOR_93g619 [Gonium pectorale]
MPGTAVRRAAPEGHLEVVKELLAAGADVNAADEDRRTPLHYAAFNGQPEVVKVLLAVKWVNVNAVDKDRRTPLHYAASNGHLEVVKVLLAAEWVDVNAVDKRICVNLQDQRTPLHFAAAAEEVSDRVEVVKKLLERGAKKDTADKVGKTPLHWAAEKDHIDIVMRLLEQSADPDVKDKDGATPLQLTSPGATRDAFIKYLFSKVDAHKDVYDWFGEKQNVYTCFLVVWISYLRPLEGVKRPSLWIASVLALAVAACMVMQILLPLSLLVNWKPEGIPQLFKGQYVALSSSSQLGASAEGPTVEAPILVWLRLSQVIVSLYVIFLVLFKEASFAQYFYRYSSELSTVLEDHAIKRKAAMLIVGAITLIYTGVFALVQFVTLVLISNSSDPPTVILNGVGAIFILEFDETIARVFVSHYPDAVYGVLAKKLLHQSGKDFSEAGAAKVASPHDEDDDDGDSTEEASAESWVWTASQEEEELQEQEQLQAAEVVAQQPWRLEELLALVRSAIAQQATFGNVLLVLAWSWCSAISLYHLITLNS